MSLGLRYLPVATLIAMLATSPSERAGTALSAADRGTGRLITNAIGMRLALAPAGSFSMGSVGAAGDERADEVPRRAVKITKPFYIGTYEVTQAEYREVMGVNPSYFSSEGKGKAFVVDLDTDHFPVERVKGNEAEEFCRKLSELSAEKAAGRVYRLPTEAEWEYACRAGTTTEFSLGDSLSSLQANFNGDLASVGAKRGPFLGRSTTVGSYRANPLGLYDMHGNVSEWCADKYDPSYYEKSVAEDPPGPTGGSGRVLRGGAWGHDANACRSSYRDHSIDPYGYRTRGFRVVLGEWKQLPVSAPTAADRFDPVFQDRVRPFVEHHCVSCHGGRSPKGGLALDGFRRAADVATIGRKQWKLVRDKLLAGTMPPADEDQPPAEESAAVQQWIDDALAGIPFAGATDPGHETIRRLNRAEYANTIRDLLGVRLDTDEVLLTDDVGAPAAALTLAPVQMERYMAVAARVSAEVVALKDGKPVHPQAHARVFGSVSGDGSSRADAARTIVGGLASRAFRRPATETEIDRLTVLAEEGANAGETIEAGVGAALEAILVSPHFLFRVEEDRYPNDPKAVRWLNDYELATRMSYFLWSSMPDDELFTLAREGSLSEKLAPQVARMLKDPKGTALTEHFGATWLQLGQLRNSAPDKGLFPDFDDALREDMETETRMFLSAIAREDRSILDIVDADFTFVNARLARHYGMKEVTGDGFRRVTWGDGPRGGLLSHASVLTLTSNPNRTSPVKRGKWILQNILGAPPAAPPPGASVLDEGDAAVASGSFRARLEHHRKNPRCASCHRKMDALGFAFENFDAIGRWRTEDGGFPIDAVGTLPGDITFDGPRALRALVRGHMRDAFVRCLTEKMLGYALGRELEYYDEPAVEKIIQVLRTSGYRFSTLVVEVIRSEPFRKRRGRRKGTM